MLEHFDSKYALYHQMSTHLAVRINPIIIDLLSYNFRYHPYTLEHFEWEYHLYRQISKHLAVRICLNIYTC